MISDQTKWQVARDTIEISSKAIWNIAQYQIEKILKSFLCILAYNYHIFLLLNETKIVFA